MKLIRAFGLAIGGVLAVYLVGRGIAEFFTVSYSDPASYRLDWGGPSLAGASRSRNSEAQPRIEQVQLAVEHERQKSRFLQFIAVRPTRQLHHIEILLPRQQREDPRRPGIAEKGEPASVQAQPAEMRSPADRGWRRHGPKASDDTDE